MQAVAPIPHRSGASPEVVRRAPALGSVPLSVGDVRKVTIAGLTVWRLGTKTRALR